MIKAILKNVMIFFMGVIGSVIIMRHINEDFGFLCFLVLAFIYILRVAVWVRDVTNKSEIKSNYEFVKGQPKSYNNLFTWLGEEKSSDRIIYELIGDVGEKSTTLETLKELKEKVEEKINGDLTDCYLIREMIKNSRKESFGEFFKSWFSQIAAGSVIVAIITGIIKEGYMNRIMEELGLNQSNLLANILTIIIYSLLILIFISTIYSIVTKSKRRANIILVVLDEIIKEKEGNNSI